VLFCASALPSTFLQADPTGYSAAVVPVKLRFVLGGSSSNDLVFGVGLVEADIFSNGRFDAWIEGGTFLEGALGKPSGGGYVIYYY